MRLCDLLKLTNSSRPPHSNRLMPGDGQGSHPVVPNSYAEAGLQAVGAAYQGFLSAQMEQQQRSVDNLHSPPEPAGSSYSSPAFLSVRHPPPQCLPQRAQALDLHAPNPPSK